MDVFFLFNSYRQHAKKYEKKMTFLHNLAPYTWIHGEGKDLLKQVEMLQ